MLLVSVPLQTYGNGTQPFGDIQNQLGNSATVTDFEIPALRVGTLDSLMILDEELAKVDIMAEQSLSKIIRQFKELQEADEDSGAQLQVKGQSTTESLESFAWDKARFTHTRRLDELMKMIQQSIAKVDEDLKALGQDYAEIKQTLSTLSRKRAANLMVSNLEDVLTDDACMQACGKVPEEIFQNTRFIQSVAVVVPKAAKDTFLSSYSNICSGEASLSDGTTFSPVVPGSAFQIMEDNDGYILYRVRLLKGSRRSNSNNEKDEAKTGVEEAQESAVDTSDFLSLFTASCRANRYLVKPYTLNNDSDGDEDDEDENLDAQIARAKADRDRQMQYLKLRCAPYFEEVYFGWIHIKAIRVFVESVLRYGVPPQFHSALIVPSSAKFMRKIRQVLEKSFSNLDTMGASKLALSDDQQRMLSTTASNSYLPYVCVGVDFLN